jgi:hypothetical protein
MSNFPEAQDDLRSKPLFSNRGLSPPRCRKGLTGAATPSSSSAMWLRASPPHMAEFQLTVKLLAVSDGSWPLPVPVNDWSGAGHHSAQAASSSASKGAGA